MAEVFDYVLAIRNDEAPYDVEGAYNAFTTWRTLFAEIARAAERD